jgi:hypothetical protein
MFDLWCKWSLSFGQMSSFITFDTHEEVAVKGTSSIQAIAKPPPLLLCTTHRRRASLSWLVKTETEMLQQYLSHSD